MVRQWTDYYFLCLSTGNIVSLLLQTVSVNTTETNKNMLTNKNCDFILVKL